jgi:Tol biopolymer transport system component
MDSSPLAPSENKYEIWRYDPNSKEKRRVMPIDGSPVRWDSGLTVSPDGRWILFAHMDRAQTEIMMMENVN